MTEMGEKEKPLAKRVVVAWGLPPLSTSDVLGAKEELTSNSEFTGH